MSLREELIMDALVLKVSAGITASGTVLSAFFAQGANLPFFNVPLTTLGMSAAGSMLAFAYGTPVDSRKKLYGYAIGGTFIGIWVVQILPAYFGWKWYLPIMEPPFAGIVALLSRWIVPFAVEQIPSLWRRIFGGQSTPPAGG